MKYTDRHGKKYVFDIGTRLIYATSMIPKDGQTYPGFGDEGTIIAISEERHAMTPDMPDVIVKFDRCGIHTEGIASFWPPGSKAAQVGQALAKMTAKA